MPLQPRITTRHDGGALPDVNLRRRGKDGPRRWIAHPGLADRLWSGAAERMDAGELAEARVVLLGFSSEHLSGLRESLHALGVPVAAASPSVLELPSITEMGLAFSHVLVHFDAFEDVESGVDALSAFRAMAPETVVVACSAFVGGDDLSSERSMICDATLRLPLSTTRLRNALVAATGNHDDREVGTRRSPGL